MSEIDLRPRRASLQNTPTPMTRSVRPSRLYRVARIPPKGFSLCPCLPQSRIGCTAYHIMAGAIMVQFNNTPSLVCLKNTLCINVAETYGIWTIPTTVSQRPPPRPGRTGPGGHFLAKKGQKMPKKGGERTGESFCSGLIKGFWPENGHFWAIFRGPDPHFRAYPGWGGLPPLFRGCMGDLNP